MLLASGDTTSIVIRVPAVTATVVLAPWANAVPFTFIEVILFDRAVGVSTMLPVPLATLTV